MFIQILLFFQMPRNELEWKRIAQDYYKRWNFPNCVGAMDGKHIAIQAPINSGSEFFNYKHYFSLVLFAVVDANYNFIYAKVGCQGRISDGGVFSDTRISKLLEGGKLNLPPDSELPGSNQTAPYVFVGDDAFPLKVNIMKPYPGIQEKESQTRIFNYRLSRARRMSENVFGIMCSIFRSLRRPMLLQPETTRKVVMAILYLHNFLRKQSCDIYNPPGSFDIECLDSGMITPGIWRRDAAEQNSLINLRRIPRRSALDAQRVRDKFKDYFVTPEGEVPWQYRLC